MVNAAAVNHGQAGDRFEHVRGERGLEHLDQRPRRPIAILEFAPQSGPLHEIEPKPLIESLMVADHDVVE